ncbi:MAG: hypothetical protein QNL91_17255 [Candidatus Krumholzibacteria bacterium]|nr:hypothetical protein [Candidatus Krumholzibacteria bacterium]
MTILFLALVVTLGSSTSYADQEYPVALRSVNNTDLCNGLKSGTRIKLKVAPDSMGVGPSSTEANGYIVGDLHECNDGVLLFWPRNSTNMVQVSVTDVQSLSISNGKSGHALAGAGVGLVIGLVTGMAAKTHGNNPGSLEDEFLEPVTNTAVVTSSAISGLLIGAAIGALIRTDKWNTLWDDKTVITALDYRPGEYEVAVGFSF